MNPKILDLAQQAGMYVDLNGSPWPKWMGAEECEVAYTRFAELILANDDELKRMMNTDPINKPFELNPKFVAKCDEIGRSRRQFQ